MEEDTIESRKNGPVIYETSEKFEKGRDAGLYLMDLSSGSVVKLDPLVNFQEFIDNDRVLAYIQSPSGEGKKRLVTFDTSSFEATYNIKDDFDINIGQFDFTRNGKRWTFTYSQHPTTDASVIFADFPSISGTTVDSGGWADVQFSSFSPDGNKIAYLKREGELIQGVPKNIIWIYDVNTKQKNRAVEGFTYWWINNNALIVQSYADVEKNTSKYTKYDLSTKQQTLLYSE